VTQRALPLGAAFAWVLVAGVAAQLVAGLASAWVHVTVGTSMDALLVPTMWMSAGTLILVALLAPVLARVPLKEALGVRSASPVVFVAAALGTTALGPTGDLLMSLMDEVAPDLTLGSVPALNEAASRIALPLAWPAFALLPGLGEELLFRGLLQRAARRGAQAIVISGATFALFHVDPHHVIGVLPLGLFLAWVAERAGVLVTAVAHVANNTAALLVARGGGLHVGYGTEHAMPWTWIPSSLAVAAASAWLVRRHAHPAR
jgi:membrane protease YdiL (CAAX protease family)